MEKNIINYIRQLSYLLMLAFFGVSCGQAENNKSAKLLSEPFNNWTEPKNSFSGDTISSSCAVIITPTNKIIDSLKHKNEEDFYIAADDNQYYIGMAREFLASHKTKILDKEAKGKLWFKTANGEITEIDLSKFNWGILLFNGTSTQIKVDITNFESEYNQYMK
jgi:hypothetical protein